MCLSHRDYGVCQWEKGWCFLLILFSFFFPLKRGTWLWTNQTKTRHGENNMHHSLEGFFFQGILLQSELAWEVSLSSPPGLSCVIWRTMNTTSFIGSPGIIMQPVSLQGSRGEQDSRPLPRAPLPSPSALCCLSGIRSPAAARVHSGSATASLWPSLPGCDGPAQATTWNT